MVEQYTDAARVTMASCQAEHELSSLVHVVRVSTLEMVSELDICCIACQYLLKKISNNVLSSLTFTAQFNS